MIEQRILRGDLNLQPFPFSIQNVSNGRIESAILTTGGHAGKIELFEYRLSPDMNERYIVQGDIPVKENDVNNAISQLKHIEGCDVIDIHPHEDEHDIHPICFFELYSSEKNKDNVEDFWSWVHTWVVKQKDFR
ncbi:MAG: hypothetical protein KGY67_00475 [Candidatus Thermoplasmatota archaeon]|nr:hypothetical protein [Candidatus Thermoplasmatota archaeon]